MHLIERIANFVIAALCAALIYALSPAALKPGYGVPPKDLLTQYSGTLDSWEYKYVARGRQDISLRIVNNPKSFVYASKAGGYPQVTQALSPGVKLTLLGKPYSGNFINRNPTAVGIYEIAVNDAVIRSYEDVKLAWTDNDKLTPYLIGLFAIGVLLFLTQGITGHNFTRKRPSS